MRELGGFVLGEKIHTGPMSDVFRVARAPGAGGAPEGGPLLMKIPRTRPRGGIQARLGFETEIAVMPFLSGPHVPRLLASGPIDQTPYVVLECVEGTSLAATVAERAPLPAEEVASIGAAVADALNDLHRQEAIHLDVK